MHEPTSAFWVWSGRATTLSAIATMFLVVSPLAPETPGDKAQWAMVVWLSLYAVLLASQVVWHLRHRRTTDRRVG